MSSTSVSPSRKAALQKTTYLVALLSAPVWQKRKRTSFKDLVNAYLADMVHVSNGELFRAVADQRSLQVTLSYDEQVEHPTACRPEAGVGFTFTTVVAIVDVVPRFTRHTRYPTRNTLQTSRSSNIIPGTTVNQQEQPILSTRCNLHLTVIMPPNTLSQTFFRPSTFTAAVLRSSKPTTSRTFFTTNVAHTTKRTGTPQASQWLHIRSRIANIARGQINGSTGSRVSGRRFASTAPAGTQAGAKVTQSFFKRMWESEVGLKTVHFWYVEPLFVRGGGKRLFWIGWLRLLALCWTDESYF